MINSFLGYKILIKFVETCFNHMFLSVKKLSTSSCLEQKLQMNLVSLLSVLFFSQNKFCVD